MLTDSATSNLRSGSMEVSSGINRLKFDPWKSQVMFSYSVTCSQNLCRQRRWGPLFPGLMTKIASNLHTLSVARPLASTLRAPSADLSWYCSVRLSASTIAAFAEGPGYDRPPPLISSCRRCGGFPPTLLSSNSDHLSFLASPPVLSKTFIHSFWGRLATIRSQPVPCWLRLASFSLQFSYL